MSTRQKFRRPFRPAVLAAIALVTFKEAIRDKILYGILVFAILLFGVAVLAARLSYIQPDRVIIDFGVSALNLSCSFIGVLFGAVMLIKEFERRTIHVALSHPISKFDFVLGKFFGLFLLLFVNWCFFVLTLTAILAGFAVDPNAVLSASLFTATFFVFIQSLVLGSIALLLSTFSTTSISVMLCIGFYLIGNNVSQIRNFASNLESPVARVLAHGFSLTLPNLEYFNLGTKATYALPISLKFGLASTSYGLVLVAFFLFLAGFTIQGKDN